MVPWGSQCSVSFVSELSQAFVDRRLQAHVGQIAHLHRMNLNVGDSETLVWSVKR